MLQERSDGGKDSARLDLLIIVVFVLLIVFIKRIAAFIKALPEPWNVVLQAALFLVLVALCYFLYAKRIRDYRYSIVYHQPGEGEENIFGEEKPYPWKEGTVLFERMIANKGRFVGKIEPAELVALLAPGEEYAEKIGFSRTESFSGKSARKSFSLVYRRRNKLFAVRFSPSEEMAARVREAIAANAAQ